MLIVISLIFLFYIYYGYFFVLWLIVKFASNDKKKYRNEYEPDVAVLLAVKDEQENVLDRIKNILDSDYPLEKLKVYVVSDHSVDSTCDIVSELKLDNVVLLDNQNEPGKSSAQNYALKYIKEEIVVYTDAGTRFDSKFIKKIVEPLQFDNVGLASGKLCLIDKGINITKTHNSYWSQEQLIRKYESQIGIMFTASGACFAVKKKYIPFVPNIAGDDCVIPLNVCIHKLLVLHVDDAIAYDEFNISYTGEFKSRVRMTLRNIAGTMFYKDLFNPFSNFKFLLSIISHKILRWMSPLFLIILYLGLLIDISECFTFDDFMYFMSITVFAIILTRFGRLRRISDKFFVFVYSFHVANAAFLLAWIKYLFNIQIKAYK